jgi:hypothetical protein
MTTKVIHIRDSTKAEDEVYIGRAGKGHAGQYGNPVVIGKICPICNLAHHDRGATLPCYEEYLLGRLAADEKFAETFWKLKGKTLVCFCKPNPCHGDIMAKILDKQNK